MPNPYIGKSNRDLDESQLAVLELLRSIRDARTDAKNAHGRDDIAELHDFDSYLECAAQELSGHLDDIDEARSYTPAAEAEERATAGERAIHLRSVLG